VDRSLRWAVPDLPVEQPTVSSETDGARADPTEREGDRPGLFTLVSRADHGKYLPFVRFLVILDYISFPGVLQAAGQNRRKFSEIPGKAEIFTIIFVLDVPKCRPDRL
jgi:hypothetical protein